jgi:NADH-quinone oxidoreductase subunit E
MTNKIETKLSNNPDFIEKDLKNSGLRLTDSRKDILNLMSKIKSPLTADELYVLAHKNNPKIGIATVYRTIGLLEKMSYLRKYFDESIKSFRYELNYDSAKVNLNTHKNLKAAKTIKTAKSIEHRKGFLDTNLAARQSIYNFLNGKEDSNDIEKIRKIQVQLNTWMNDLNQIKKEKELELEDMIKDFNKMDKVLEKHNYENSNLIQMLIDFQSEYNWLPKHVLFYVSSKLNIPLTNIYNIATFYKFFNIEPRGKYTIVVCAGTACHVRGSMNLLQRIVNVLGIKPGDTTGDFKFTLDTVNCLGCCALGPVMMLNNKYYSNPSKKELEKLFNNIN